jgi:hypothetical protein
MTEGVCVRGTEGPSRADWDCGENRMGHGMHSPGYMYLSESSTSVKLCASESPALKRVPAKVDATECLSSSSYIFQDFL